MPASSPWWAVRFRARLGAQALIDIKYAHPSVPERTSLSPSHIEISYPESQFRYYDTCKDVQLLNILFKQQDRHRLRKDSHIRPLHARITRNLMYGRSPGLDDRTLNLNAQDESNALACCHLKYVRLVCSKPYKDLLSDSLEVRPYALDEVKLSSVPLPALVDA
jgi:hypothetical protein